MAAPRFAWGIDIGNRALKAVKLIPAGDGLAIDDFEVIEHETVLSASGDNRDELIRTALANFVQRHPGIEKGMVGVGVTGQQSFARFIKLPPVETKKIPEIVRFEAIQQIPFPLDEVEWSYQLFEEPDSPEVEVGIFAMRKDLVNAHIKFFTDAKLNVQVVQMNPLAVYNAMYYDTRIKGTTMIIDVGAENTDLIIAEGESVWLRSISIGGNSFTDALGKAFKVNFAKAEELKRNASTSKYGRQIMQAMRPIFSDLVSEIQRSIGFYSSVHKESRIGKVIAIGSTFKLPGLARYLSQNLTLEVEKLDRLGSGALEDPKIAAAFSENLLSAAGAYGLALQVMNQGKINSSLLPESIRRDKMWAEKTKWFVGAAALFMVGAAIPYGRWYYDYSQFNDNEHADLRSTIDTTKSQAASIDSDWSTIEGANTVEKQRLLNVLALTDDRDIWPQINSLIYSNLPQSAPDAPKELSSSNPDEVKKIKRDERNELVITAMTSRYTSDLTPFLDDLGTHVDPNVNTVDPTRVPFETATNVSFADLGRNDLTPPTAAAPSGDAAAVAPTKPQRGYVITLKLTTPSKLGAQLVDQFNGTLKSLPVNPDHPMQVVKAVIVNQKKIRDDAAAVQSLVAIWNAKQAAKQEEEREATNPQAPSGGGGGGIDAPPMGGGGFGGGGGFRPLPGMERGGGGAGWGGMPPPTGVAANGEKIDPEAYNDPVLKEDVRDDTECVVVIAVSLEPPPPPKPEATAAGTQPPAAPGAPATPETPATPPAVPATPLAAPVTPLAAPVTPLAAPATSPAPGLPGATPPAVPPTTH